MSDFWLQTEKRPWCLKPPVLEQGTESRMELWRADALLSPETSWCWAQEGEARAWLRQLREGRLCCRKKGGQLHWVLSWGTGSLLATLGRTEGAPHPIQASCALRQVTHHWKPAKTSPTLRDLDTLSSSPWVLCAHLLSVPWLGQALSHLRDSGWPASVATSSHDWEAFRSWLYSGTEHPS